MRLISDGSCFLFSFWFLHADSFHKSLIIIVYLLLCHSLYGIDVVLSNISFSITFQNLTDFQSSLFSSVTEKNNLAKKHLLFKKCEIIFILFQLFHSGKYFNVTELKMKLIFKSLQDWKFFFWRFMYTFYIPHHFNSLYRPYFSSFSRKVNSLGDVEFFTW